MKKNILFLGIGLVVGGIGGFLCGRLVEKKALTVAKQDPAEDDGEIEDKYRRQVREYNDEDDNREPDRITKNDMNKYHQEKREAQDYSAYYGQNEQIAAEAEHPVDSDEDDEISSEEEQETMLREVAEMEEEMFEEHQRNKDRPPRIISAEAYSDLPPGYDTQVLYYYTEDDTLCDENGEPIECNYDFLIGDALTKYNFAESDEQIIFVQNFNMQVCYEIQKFDMAFADSGYADRVIPQ